MIIPLDVTKLSVSVSCSLQVSLLASQPKESAAGGGGVLPKARSMAERCRQKPGVKFSAVFVTVRFQNVLSVFGEKAESNFTFSEKVQSETNRRLKCGVKLCAFGSIQHI